MKGKGLTLTHKGILVVLVLIVMEGLFVGVHIWLLNKAEAEAKRAEETREIISKATELMQMLYNAGDSVAKYAFNRDVSALARYEVARQDVARTMPWLKEHLAADRAQAELFKKIEPSVEKGMALIAEMKKVSDQEPPAVAMQFGLRQRLKMQRLLEGLVHDLIDLLNVERRIVDRSPALQKQNRDYVMYLLMAGLVANVFAALALASFFIKNITSRLAVVVENSDRLRDRRNLKPPLLGNDDIANLDMTFHDMSQALRSEEEMLARSEEQLRAIIAQMPLGLFIIVGDQIEYANNKAEKDLLAKPGALTGANLSDFYQIPRGANLTEQIVAVKARRVNGDQFTAELSMSEMVQAGWKQARQNRRLVIVKDITQRLEIEKMREAFVSMVSHDLRTPLTSVAGFLELLPVGVYGPVSPPAVEQCKLASTEVANLIVLINDLLDLQKLEAGQLDMENSRVSLEDILDESVDSVYSLADEQGVAVLFEGCESMVVGDMDRLNQAFSKILSAMLRLTPNGGTIKVALGAEADSKLMLVFSSKELVLPPDAVASIFEPFQEVESPRGKSVLGLGLALARAIIRQHGGLCGSNINATEGTRLWFILGSSKA